MPYRPEREQVTLCNDNASKPREKLQLSVAGPLIEYRRPSSSSVFENSRPKFVPSTSPIRLKLGESVGFGEYNTPLWAELHRPSQLRVFGAFSVFRPPQILRS